MRIDGGLSRTVLLGFLFWYSSFHDMKRKRRMEVDNRGRWCLNTSLRDRKRKIEIKDDENVIFINLEYESLR